MKKTSEDVTGKYTFLHHTKNIEKMNRVIRTLLNRKKLWGFSMAFLLFSQINFFAQELNVEIQSIDSLNKADKLTLI